MVNNIIKSRSSDESSKPERPRRLSYSDRILKKIQDQEKKIFFDTVTDSKPLKETKRVLRKNSDK